MVRLLGLVQVSARWYESDDPDTVRSRTGYSITYARCPIYWTSKLQTEITMSSAESEYVALSEALGSVIPMMSTLEEMAKHKIQLNTQAPKKNCRVFEDSSGALEMATSHKYRPRTKHLGVKYHFFRRYANVEDNHTQDQKTRPTRGRINQSIDKGVVPATPTRANGMVKDIKNSWSNKREIVRYNSQFAIRVSTSVEIEIPNELFLENRPVDFVEIFTIVGGYGARLA